jgi:hypothetical protein
MPIYDQTQLENIPPHVVGIRVSAAAARITVADKTLFTVAGGNVIMTWFYGEVIVVQSNTACTLTLTHTPTIGTATAMAAGATDIALAAAGMCLQLPAVVGATLTLTTTAVGLPLQRGRYLLRPGVMSIAGSDTPTGSVAWTMFYVPAEPGAYVTGS